MQKSTRNFIVFWVIAIILLLGWFAFWEMRNGRIFKTMDSVIDYVPLSQDKKDQYQALTYFADYFLQNDNVERTFMVLFQNSMELRPGGGFIGSFGILKIKNGNASLLQVHDLSNFDGRIPDTITPPYPMEEFLHIKSWKLRDSNYSPDWAKNAEKAEEFYRMGNGQENLDGIIGINSHLLSSILEVTGPITVEGYPGNYDSENAILTLEHQVERAYAEQGITKGERKSIMQPLAKEISKRVIAMSGTDKVKLASVIMKDLNQKDIQLYFKDKELQSKVEEAGWSGEVNYGWRNDYLFMVDANLGAYKSDYYMKRSFDYSVDLSKEVPTAKLKITYNHTAKVKDWMTNNYLTYLRVYVPRGSWLVNSSNLNEIKYGEEFGKKYFGSVVDVKIGEAKTVEFEYALPSGIKDEYDLLIEKQAGIENLPGHITIIDRDGKERGYDVNIEKDWILDK